jgi:hypothetical protein
MMTYTLIFTEQEMQILNQALGELPFKFAAPLVNSINRQIAAAANGKVRLAADAGDMQETGDGN